MAHLVTGYAGYAHIKSEDDGAFNAAFFGTGQYITETGNQFAGSIIDNNTVRILDGDGLMYGRHFRIKPNTYEDVTITTGTAGKNRIDLICMTYKKNASDGTETAYLQVIKGTEAEGTPEVPEYTDGNILEGAEFNQMPLYKVNIAGVVLSDIIPVFDTIPTYRALAAAYETEFKNACKTYLDSLGLLDTIDEIYANTKENQLAGALAVKTILAKVLLLEDTSKLSTNHTHAADKVTAGTLSGQVRANETAMSDVESGQIRDIYATTTDLTAGTSALASGKICLVYE